MISDSTESAVPQEEAFVNSSFDSEGRFRHTLLFVFLVALILRMLFVWIQASFHVFDIYFVASDSRVYEALAHNLLSGAGYALDGRPTALVTPAYPIFLAVLHWLGVDTPIGVGFVQSFVGAATCVLIAMVGRYLDNSYTAIVAGILSASYVHLIFWTGYILTETLFVFLVIASLVALLRWQEDVNSRTRAALAGLLLGVGSLTRPHLLGFAVLAFCWVVVAAGGKRGAAALSGVFLVLGLVAVLAPWTLRNYRSLGIPLVGSTLGGEVLYQGNSIGATGGTGGYLDARDFQRLQLDPGLSEVEIDRAYSRVAWQFILHQPGRLPRLAVKKFINMWRPTYEGASFRNLVIFGGNYLLVVALGVVGVARLSRVGFGRFGGLIFICLAYFVLIHLIVPGMIRYRLPAEPLLILFAATTAKPVLKRFSNESMRSNT